MKQLMVGKSSDDGSAFKLPVELVTETSAVIGRRGSGKTNTGVVCAEELLSGGQTVVVLDPLNVWWGIKSSATGKSAGQQVVILGDDKLDQHDLPLSDGDGAILADFIVDERVSSILSLRHLSKSGQRRFVAGFAERLYERKGEAEHRSPLLVIVDEASTFVPQRFTGDAARMVGAIESLVRRGRASGIGVMLIDQRPASVNKDVLTQTELLVAHQVTSPQDRKALELWIEAHDVRGQREQFMDSLAALKLGEAWFWSPGWLDVFDRVQVRARKTFDSSRTPKVGEVAAKPERSATVDLKALRERLESTIADAEKDDPAKLRAKIAQLEKQAKQSAAEADPAVIEQACAKAVAAAVAPWSAYADELHGELRKLVTATAGATAAAESLLEKSPPAVDDKAVRAASSRPRPAKVTRDKPAARDARSAAKRDGGDESLSRAQRAILTALAQRQPAASNNTQISVLSGYSRKSSSFQNALAALRSAGLASGYKDAIAITAEGLAALGDYDAPPSNGELFDWWASKLQKAERAILAALVEAHPASLDKEQLSESSGYSATSSSLQNALSKLRTLGLIEGYGEMHAGAALMEATQ